MIYLYDSTETDFRYNGKPLPIAYDVTVSNTLNSEYYVMGKYPLDKDKVYKEIVEDRIIKVHTMDGMQPFRIVSVNKQELYVEFEAWPLFYADMRNKLVKPLNLKRVSGQTALNSFKNNLLIDTPFDFYSDITDNHDYHTQDENERENNPKQLYNALDVFKTIVSRWGGELWIRGYDIRVNKRIGTDTEAMLYEKKNITEFVDTTNIEGIVTRVHGKSEWQDEPQEGEEEGQKHSIEATVDSPLINNYSGVVFEKQFTNNDVRTEQELKNWLNLKFATENIDKPQRTIEVGTNVIDETKIGFADTLILKYIKHDTDVRIKVVGYEYDGFANELKHVVLGQPKNTSSSTIGNTITDLVNNVVEPVDRKTTIAMSSADGKSTVFHGTANPNTLNLNAKENDTYFRTNGSEKEIWRYTGTLWELTIDTSETTKVAEDVLEAKGIAEIARDNALNIATDLLEGTSFYKHTQNIGLASKNSDGTINSIINLGSDGTAYIGGRNIVLDGNTIVDGTFTITDKMIAPNAEIDGAKIQDATIGSAKIASLDVSKISGDASSFVRSHWNSYAGGNVEITGDGLRSATSGLSTVLKAGEITNYSGTKSGTVNALGMQIYDSSNGQVTKLYSEGIEFGWYDVIRRITQSSEGLVITPVTGSGARLNSALSLQTGPGADKVAYLDLINSQAGNRSRLEMNGTILNLRHPNGGELDIADYAYNGRNGRINAGRFRTTTVDGRGLYIEESQIKAMAGNQTIHIIPTGTGEVRIGGGGGNPTLWPIRASQFVQGSNRASKTNIAFFTQNAVDLLNELQVVSYNRLDELARGKVSKSIGFIAEDSPFIAVYNKGVATGVDNYKMVTLAIKGVQELDTRELNTNQIASQALQLGESNEDKIKRLEKRIEELEGVM